jgi:hypothetical protein
MSMPGIPAVITPEYLAEYQGDEVIHYAIAFLVLGTFFMSLRFWSRWLGRVPWGMDDSLIVASAVFLVGIITACICRCIPTSAYGKD